MVLLFFTVPSSIVNMSLITNFHMFIYYFIYFIKIDVNFFIFKERERVPWLSLRKMRSSKHFFRYCILNFETIFTVKCFVEFQCIPRLFSTQTHFETTFWNRIDVLVDVKFIRLDFYVFFWINKTFWKLVFSKSRILLHY